MDFAFIIVLLSPRCDFMLPRFLYWWQFNSGYWLYLCPWQPLFPAHLSWKPINSIRVRFLFSHLCEVAARLTNIPVINLFLFSFSIRIPQINRRFLTTHVAENFTGATSWLDWLLVKISTFSNKNVGVSIKKHRELRRADRRTMGWNVR